MNRNQTNMFNMFISVKNFLDRSFFIWSRVISFVIEKKVFDNLIDSIYPLVTMKESDNKRVNVNKRNHYAIWIESEAALKNLSQKISEVQSVLERIDKIADIFYSKNPEFVNQYYEARKIVDFASSFASVQEENITNKVA